MVNDQTYFGGQILTRLRGDDALFVIIPHDPGTSNPEFHTALMGSADYFHLSVRPGVAKVFLNVDGAKATEAARSAYDRVHWNDRFEVDRAVARPDVVDERIQEIGRYELEALAVVVSSEN